MKTSVITRHAIANYGSFLQAIATQSIIENLGSECEIIDYIREDEYGLNLAKLALKKNEDWSYSFLKKILYLMCRITENFIMYRKFGNMRNKYLKMSKRYFSLDYDHRPEADIYITGSDQVWGPVGTERYDKNYFLDFVPDDKKKIAYAGSFGKTKFEGNDIETFKTMLSRYDAISVRENSAVDIIKGMGIKNVEQVLDPTLLIAADKWEKYINFTPKGKYILVYQIHNNPKMDKYAKAFAKANNMKLVRVTPLLHQRFRGGKFVYLPNIGKFLAYIKNADFMITDSFHGTAFAINFNTQFVDILPGETGSRNQSILELTGLEDRIVTDFNDYGFMKRKIDFDRVNKIIEENRKKSIDILKDMLERGKL